MWNKSTPPRSIVELKLEAHKSFPPECQHLVNELADIAFELGRHNPHLTQNEDPQTGRPKHEVFEAFAHYMAVVDPKGENQPISVINKTADFGLTTYGDSAGWYVFALLADKRVMSASFEDAIPTITVSAQKWESLDEYIADDEAGWKAESRLPGYDDRHYMTGSVDKRDAIYKHMGDLKTAFDRNNASPIDPTYPGPILQDALLALGIYEDGCPSDLRVESQLEQGKGGVEYIETGGGFYTVSVKLENDHLLLFHSSSRFIQGVEISSEPWESFDAYVEAEQLGFEYQKPNYQCVCEEMDKEEITTDMMMGEFKAFRKTFADAGFIQEEYRESMKSHEVGDALEYTLGLDYNHPHSAKANSYLNNFIERWDVRQRQEDGLTPK